MNDHGTKVQCDKCKEWVSGSHNCDTWSMECGECGGSGFRGKSFACPLCPDYTEGLGHICRFLYEPERESSECQMPCPTCHGKRIELEVKCGCTSALRGSNCHGFHGSDHYRLMTVEMVNELTCSESEPQECPTKFDPAICYTCEYCNYKGAKVRIKGGIGNDR